MKKRRFFRRVFAIAVLTTLASANAFGLSNTYYYRTNAAATGSGTVYAGVDVIAPSTATYASSSTTDAVTDSIHYVFAKPNSGQAFMYWTTDASTDSICGDNPMKVTFTDVAKSTSSTSPAEKSFKAVFGPAVVFAEVNDGDQGAVKVSPASNTVGNHVTLTATPSQNIVFGTEFEGWYRQGETTPVSTNATYSFTIDSNNQGTYIAKFKRNKGYFRIKSQYTNKYMKLVGTSYEVANGGSYGFYGAIFDNSIVLNRPVDLTDPGYIVKIDGDIKGDSLLENIEVYCQGLSMRDSIIAQQYHGVSVTLEQRPNCAVFYFDQSGTKRFLKDGANYGYNCAIVCGGESDHQWTLEPVDENSETKFFGVNAPIELDGYYYTTLYTSFPYQCGDDVEAYYVISDGEGGWTLEEIPDYKVPSNTPVILCCADSLATNNRLIPLFDEPSPIDGIEDNLLEGFISINYSESGSQYVLSTDGDNLTFVQAASVSSNQAYYTGNFAGARIFGGKSTGIKEVHIQNSDRFVYDVSGRKISNRNENLSPGLYIINGKKQIVK